MIDYTLHAQSACILNAFFISKGVLEKEQKRTAVKVFTAKLSFGQRENPYVLLFPCFGMKIVSASKSKGISLQSENVDLPVFASDFKSCIDRVFQKKMSSVMCILLN